MLPFHNRRYILQPSEVKVWQGVLLLIECYSHHQRSGQSVFSSGFPSGFALGKSLGSRGAKPMAAGNLSRFPSTLEISLGLRPREISWVSGNLGRRGWIFQSLPPLGGARIQSFLAGWMHAKSIPAEWNRLIVVKSILPW